MERSWLKTYSLFPVITVWGVLLGGIVYSHTAFFPVYLSDLPNSSVIVHGKYAFKDAPFWVTMQPLMILSLIFALALNWKAAARRQLIALSFGIYLAVLIATWIYFVPELLAFAKSLESPLPASDWLARGHRWEKSSLIRGVVCFIGFVPLLIANTKQDDEVLDKK